MEKRTLGRTGHESTVVSFGTAALGEVSQDVADEAIELVLNHGVNHIDIAPSYGQAMERMAPWMPKIRNQVFLGSKTLERTRDEAWQDIHSIMRRLNVESFDLFQLHSVTSMDLLDQVTAPAGALEALLEMRDQGLTKWIGITGHGYDALQVQMEAMKRFDTDTIMFAYCATMSRNPDYRREAEKVLEMAHAKNVGLQIIKMLARGGWGDRKADLATWYDPYRDQSEIDRALWWLLSQPIHTAASTGDVTILPKLLDAAERFAPLGEAEQEEIVASQRPPLPHPALGILPA